MPLPLYIGGNMFQSSFDYAEIVITLLSIPAYLLFFTARGYGQAWTARRLGDDTPALNGFLSLNPLAHINIIGFICLIILGFGFGKTVPTNSRNYKNVKAGTAIQILSAPVFGLLLAFIASLLFFILFYIGSFFDLVYEPSFVPYLTAPMALLKSMVNVSNGAVTYSCILIVLMRIVEISIYLTIFFLLPLPGFDGYRLIVNFIPYRFARTMYNIEKYNFFIFIGFIMIITLFPAIHGAIIGTPTNAIFSLFTQPFWKIVKMLM